MKLYLKIATSHKIVLFLLLCGLCIYFFSFEMFLYKFVMEYLNHALWNIQIFFYFLIVLVLAFNLHLILDKMLSVCKAEFDVLLLCGFPLEDIIKKFMMLLSLCGMLSGMIAAIMFFFLVLGNIGFTILLLGITYLIFCLLGLLEYKKIHKELSGRFSNV